MVFGPHSAVPRVTLALRSGITPANAQGTIWDAGDHQTLIGHMQGKHLPHFTKGLAPGKVLFLLVCFSPCGYAQ